MQANPAALIPAVAAAMAGAWQTAHTLTQVYEDPLANWLHAVLHKIEGDVANSHYWYARSAGHHYNDFLSPTDELHAIQAALQRAPVSKS